LLVCLCLLFHSLWVNVEWGEATGQGASIPSRGRLFICTPKLSWLKSRIYVRSGRITPVSDSGNLWAKNFETSQFACFDMYDTFYF
jgi:hypothetical protein